MSQSEVAKLREKIRSEYEASQRVFTGFTPTARDEYMIKRTENIGICFQELSQLMPPEEAIAIVAETLNNVQSSGSLSGSTS